MSGGGCAVCGCGRSGGYGTGGEPQHARKPCRRGGRRRRRRRRQVLLFPMGSRAWQAGKISRWPTPSSLSLPTSIAMQIPQRELFLGRPHRPPSGRPRKTMTPGRGRREGEGGGTPGATAVRPAAGGSAAAAAVTLQTETTAVVVGAAAPNPTRRGYGERGLGRRHVPRPWQAHGRLRAWFPNRHAPPPFPLTATAATIAVTVAAAALPHHQALPTGRMRPGCAALTQLFHDRHLPSDRHQHMPPPLSQHSPPGRSLPTSGPENQR